MTRLVGRLQLSASPRRMAVGLLAAMRSEECVTVNAKFLAGLARFCCFGGTLIRSVSRIASILLAWFATGATNDSTAYLLERYRTATCLPSKINPEGIRVWDSTMALRNESKVSVHAAAFAGGNHVVLSYADTGREDVAAKPYDYVYPIEIRLDPQDDTLYIAANGRVAGVWEQTWFYAFDLRTHRQIARRWIRYRDLPSSCSGTSAK
jgi:hypothetical protein